MAERGNEFKGSSFTLSVLHLTDTDPQQIKELLSSKVAQAPQFFQSAPLVVNIEELEITPDFDEIKQIIEDEGFVLVGVSGAQDEQTREAAKQAGLAVMTAGRSVESAEPAARQETPAEPVITATRVHHGNVRSGQQIYAPGGSLVIIGSVGNGAEVIADDSIHIYGALRGRALAGARGNQQARIYCQQLEPELISIAGTYQVNDALPTEMVNKDVFIRLEQNKLIFDKLQS